MRFDGCGSEGVEVNGVHYLYSGGEEGVIGLRLEDLSWTNSPVPRSW